MRLPTLRNLVFLLMLLSLAGAAVAWRWYDTRYTRFPVHKLPRWRMFEGWRVARTQEYIQAATQAVAGFHARYGKLPYNSPHREYQFSITLGHDLSGIWTNLDRLNRDKIVFWNLPAGEQLDGWGNNLHFYFDHDNDGVVHPGVEPWLSVSGAKPVHRSFVVWSDGPNARDEGGTGDDIPGW
ncbi:MAG: hypothetical protein ACO1TE_20275 [Prosthecobacter sp.]